MRVLGISGSLRRDSYNSALLRAAAERLPAGAELVEYEGLGEIPPYDADLAGNARVGLSIATTVDRRSFGLDWNAELPSGGEVLDYEVSIAVELELAKEAE